MATKLCAYEQTIGGQTVKCKNWIVTSGVNLIEEGALCPMHAGVTKREDNLSPAEKQHNQRFEQHVAFCAALSSDELNKHILQLESLLEDVKLRQQAAASTRSKRIKEIAGNGELTEAQKKEISELRSPRFKATSEAPKQSKMEKAIQGLMKLGVSREKAIKMLEAD